MMKAEKGIRYVCEQCGKGADEHVDCFPCPTPGAQNDKHPAYGNYGNKSVLDGRKPICGVCKKPLDEHEGGLWCLVPPANGPTIGDLVHGSTSKPLDLGKLQLEVVGACPKCGSPIYGRKTVHAGELPVTQFSCQCSHAKDLADLARAK